MSSGDPGQIAGLIPWLAGSAVLALAWAVQPLLDPSPLAVRARGLRRRATAPPPRGRAFAARLRAQITGLVDRRAPAQAVRSATAQALAAGWTAPDAPALLIAAGRILPLALPAFGAVIGLSPLPLLGLALAGWFGPGLYARNMAQRRLQAIGRGLPDALDLLVICAESGLAIDLSLARTGRELAPAQPVLAAELSATAVELGFLPRRADAYANLANRVHLPIVRALADMLVQTERFGTPVAQGLRVMASEARTTRLLSAEARAARLPALMTVPMIAFILPPLFVVLIGPAVIGSLS